MTVKTITAADGSVNFIAGEGDQLLESRYVVRDAGKLICYLSSQTGCAQACRMCHLTQTGQTRPRNATAEEFRQQALAVIRYARDVGRFDEVSYNFMARGEALANPEVDDSLLWNLYAIADDYGMRPRFKISTIFPRESWPIDLAQRFGMMQPDLYYSLYSTDPEFRKRWFPRSVDPFFALEALKRWQTYTHKIPKVHLALIKGENDDAQSVMDVCEAINLQRLRVDVNVVRYNPYDSRTAEGDYERAARIFRSHLKGADVQIVNRVGFEAKASCGMFVTPERETQ